MAALTAENRNLAAENSRMSAELDVSTGTNTSPFITISTIWYIDHGIRSVLIMGSDLYWLCGQVCI